MRLTPFAKFMLALIIIGSVGYGLYLNRDKLGIRMPGLQGPTASGSAMPSASASGGTTQTKENELVIEGSTAMTKLVVGWGKMFEAAHPSVKFQRGWGGTGRGIEGLIGGTVDMAAASRPLKEKEQKIAANKSLQIKSHPVAIDAIGVIVNRGNPVTDLSLQQLAGIYTGRITNWKEVGGKNMAITFYGREKTAGMYEFFKEKILGHDDYSARMKVTQTTTAMLQAIAREPGAIGTATVAQSLKQKTVKLLGLRKSADEPAVFPFLSNDLNMRAIRQGTYALTREMYLMTSGEPAGAARDFLDLALSARGQQLVREEGYVPVG